jgi:hypothetical protein
VKAASAASAHRGVAIPAEVRDAAAAGQKVRAIQLLRAHQGLGLAEARAIVDGLPRHSPSSRARKRSGAVHDGGLRRFLTLLVVTLGLLAAVLWLTGQWPIAP